ncbi:MAG: nuclease family protein [Nevskia sp.]|nr:nuclease family protein [Nevskia sp.]
MTVEKQPCVYILASKRKGTLYIGVTSDPAKRVWQHRNAELAGFSSRYSVYRLVWFEVCADMSVAIMREKQLKKWNRMWKLRLIETTNPDWRDLAADFGLSDQDALEDRTGFPPARE